VRPSILSLVSALLLTVTGFAQSAPLSPPQQTSINSLPATPAPVRSATAKTEQEKEIEKREQSERTLGIFPHFLVTDRQDASPLSSGQKFRLFAKQAFDPTEFLLTAAQAGLSQATDQFPGYGQGGKGYAKRYGAAFGDEVSSGFWSNFFYPTLFKDDPRYFRLGQGSFGQRFGRSVKQEFICHTDNGGRSFSFSNVLGALTAGGISNIYYPRDDRGFGLTMSRAGIALAYGAAWNLVDEFGPDVRRKLFHQHQKDTQKP
jgi:hypothetical protein